MQNIHRITGFCSIAVCAAGVGLAQSAPTISGSVEASYNYNLTIPSDSMNNRFHSYDAHTKTFLLNNAHVDMSGSDTATGVGYDVQTDLGTDAALDASSNGNVFDLEQAYLTYTFGPAKAWGIKAGKYATYEGIEVIPGGANPEITRGFLFGMAEPFTHTGLEVSYSSSMWDFHLGVVNGWDQMTDVNVVPTGLVKLGLNFGNPLALTISGLMGPERATGQGGDLSHVKMSYDITGISHAINMVDLNFQGNYGVEQKEGFNGDDATWWGVGVQPLVHVNSMFGVGLRYELYSQDNGVNTLYLQNVTLAPTFWLTKTLTARAEYRIDFGSKDVFIDSNNNATGNQMEVAGDLIANF